MCDVYQAKYCETRSDGGSSHSIQYTTISRHSEVLSDSDHSKRPSIHCGSVEWVGNIVQAYYRTKQVVKNLSQEGGKITKILCNGHGREITARRK
jgi:hypothetical protein